VCERLSVCVCVQSSGRKVLQKCGITYIRLARTECVHRCINISMAILGLARTVCIHCVSMVILPELKGLQSKRVYAAKRPCHVHPCLLANKAHTRTHTYTLVCRCGQQRYQCGPLFFHSSKLETASHSAAAATRRVCGAACITSESIHTRWSTHTYAHTCMHTYKL